MSVDINVFRPTFRGVSVQPSGCIVVKLDGDGGEINLFFMLPTITADDDHPTPVEQVGNLVSQILHGAGFEAYEYEQIQGLHYHGQTVGDAWFAHPHLPQRQNPTPDWVFPHLDTVQP